MNPEEESMIALLGQIESIHQMSAASFYNHYALSPESKWHPYIPESVVPPEREALSPREKKDRYRKGMKNLKGKKRHWE